MAVIITIIGIMFLILIGWTWSNLGKIEKKTKIFCIFVGLAIVYILTFIIFNISRIGITYEDAFVMKTIRRVFVILFTIINSYIILPYVFKKLEQINSEELKKENLQRSIIILLIIVVILFIFESNYFGNIQQDILNMINK